MSGAAAERAAPVRRISASHVDDWQGCRARYYERRINRRAEAPSFVIARGRAIDTVLERLVTERMAGQPVRWSELQSWLAWAWSAEMAPVPDGRASNPLEQAAAERMLRALATATRDWSFVETQQWYERPLLPGWVLIGQIDAVVQTLEGPIVVDFKTSEKAWDSRKLLGQRQPPLYGALYAQAHGVLPQALWFVVATPDGTATRYEAPVSLDGVERALAVVRRVAGEVEQALETGAFGRGPQCRFCPWADQGGCLPEGVP